MVDYEEGVGNWMMEEGHKQQVIHRIACPELNYPMSEALYPTIKDWELANDKNWYEYLNF
jgi:hypothetical protein